jgi:hypothetical protein
MLLHRMLTPAQESQCLRRVVRPLSQPGIDKWYFHYLETKDVATFDTVYIPLVHKFKEAQGSRQMIDMPQSALTYAVPKYTLVEARQYLSDASDSSSSRGNAARKRPRDSSAVKKRQPNKKKQRKAASIGPESSAILNVAAPLVPLGRRPVRRLFIASMASRSRK